MSRIRYLNLLRRPPDAIGGDDSGKGGRRSLVLQFVTELFCGSETAAAAASINKDRRANSRLFSSHALSRALSFSLRNSHFFHFVSYDDHRFGSGAVILSLALVAVMLRRRTRRKARFSISSSSFFPWKKVFPVGRQPPSLSLSFSAVILFPRS